ncbi:MAG: hydrogenase formation protein HypD [Nitrospirae bacterium GWC2_42_7]|nr:MAG: hydrogenase formation protein HypD [Nitrospirae bacterium GWC2_42_7]
MNETLNKIKALMGLIDRQVRLMEVCGTHTVAIFRHGIRDLLPEGVKLLSGPGCPVCVTSIRDIETAIAISKVDNVILTTFGDMMRVPGEKKNLLDAKAEGSDVRIVYSPLDALQIAEDNRDKKIVFFATGFETTSPSVAGTIMESERKKADNFYVYTVHKTVPPAIKALLDSDEVNIDGFILPGHVSAIIGSKPYSFINGYNKPSVITGFESHDILTGIMMLLMQISEKRAKVEIQYARVVREEGNPKAVSIMNEYFEASDAEWRGIGTIPLSGLRLREKFQHRDITKMIDIYVPEFEEPKACSCGDILKGIKMPSECKLFGKTCTPDSPVGACMVSTEGSCAAYYKYGLVK